MGSGTSHGCNTLYVYATLFKCFSANETFMVKGEQILGNLIPLFYMNVDIKADRHRGVNNGTICCTHEYDTNCTHVVPLCRWTE